MRLEVGVRVRARARARARARVRVRGEPRTLRGEVVQLVLEGVEHLGRGRDRG